MKTVVITGASRGIGKSAATLFAENGYNVAVVFNRSIEEAEELKAKYSNCKIYKCDVASIDDITATHDKILSDFKNVDVLINNAGISLKGVFQTLTPESVKRMYDVNLFGTLNMTKAFLNDMINQKSGVVINVSSVFGEHGGSCEVDYSASKAAIIGFTKALAKETGPSNVRINCVAPGVIDTDMNADLTVSDVEQLTEIIPLEHIGMPEEVAKVMLFLASDAASYINGAVIPVDGGM